MFPRHPLLHQQTRRNQLLALMPPPENNPAPYPSPTRPRAGLFHIVPPHIHTAPTIHYLTPRYAIPPPCRKQAATAPENPPRPCSRSPSTVPPRPSTVPHFLPPPFPCPSLTYHPAPHTPITLTLTAFRTAIPHSARFCPSELPQSWCFLRERTVLCINKLRILG